MMGNAASVEEILQNTQIDDLPAFPFGSEIERLFHEDFAIPGAQAANSASTNRIFRPADPPKRKVTYQPKFNLKKAMSYIPLRESAATRSVTEFLPLPPNTLEPPMRPETAVPRSILKRAKSDLSIRQKSSMSSPDNSAGSRKWENEQEYGMWGPRRVTWKDSQ